MSDAAAQSTPRFISAEEVCAAFPTGPQREPVSMKTLRRWAKAGAIPGVVWIGRMLVFARDPLVRFILGEPTPEPASSHTEATPREPEVTTVEAAQPTPALTSPLSVSDFEDEGPRVRAFRALPREERLDEREDAIETLTREQRGRCAICRVRSDRLQLDHDHRTHEVRGLLCASCNVREGYRTTPQIQRYRDNPPARGRWLFCNSWGYMEPPRVTDASLRECIDRMPFFPVEKT